MFANLKTLLENKMFLPHLQNKPLGLLSDTENTFNLANDRAIHANGREVEANGPAVGLYGPTVGLSDTVVGPNGPTVGLYRPVVDPNGPTVGPYRPAVGTFESVIQTNYIT